MFSNKNKRAKKTGFQYAIVVLLCIHTTCADATCVAAVETLIFCLVSATVQVFRSE